MRHPLGAIVCYLLAAGPVGLTRRWARSYGRVRAFSYDGRALVLRARSGPGVDRGPVRRPPAATDRHALRDPNARGFTGVEIGPARAKPSHPFTVVSGGQIVGTVLPLPYRRLAVPYGPLVLASAAWPAVHLPQLLRRRRWRRTGRCLGCGYDLRESPGCCPECGAAGRRAAA